MYDAQCQKVLVLSGVMKRIQQAGVKKALSFLRLFSLMRCHNDLECSWCNGGATKLYILSCIEEIDAYDRVCGAANNAVDVWEDQCHGSDSQRRR